MPDFSELAEYLSSQIDLGQDKVFLDEPWAYAPRSHAASLIPERAPSPVPAFRSATSAPAMSAPRRVYSEAPAKIVIPASARSEVPFAYESAASIGDFYEKLAAEKFYAKSPLAKGEGNLESPKLLLVLYAPTEAYLQSGYAESPAGQMVTRLFGSLKIEPGDLGVTYFAKKTLTRSVLPQVAAVLRKMLEKEVQLIRPQTVIFFGDGLLKQALGQNAKAVDFGGTPLEFAGTRATSLIDPEKMLGDKALKLITWKTHIPKCEFFG